MSSLTVVGLGIQFITHVTAQASQAIQCADEVFYIVADGASEYWIKNLKPNAKSLHGHYSTERRRNDSYNAMVAEVIQALQEGANVCLVSYGHPGVFAYPTHESIRQARALGHKARMLPAVSSIDVLFADIGIDPGIVGCQTFEATDFVLYQRQFDPTSHLILLQIGVMGIQTAPTQEMVPNIEGLQLLTERLNQVYEGTHQVAVYEASQFVICDAQIKWCALANLVTSEITGLSTLYIPPLEPRSPDRRVINRLKLVRTDSSEKAVA